MGKKNKKSAVTKREEENAKKVIRGICIGLIVLMLIFVFGVVLRG